MRVIVNKTILKNSFVLLEVIFSVVLFSFIIIYTLRDVALIEQKNRDIYTQNISLLNIESTKYYLTNKDISKLIYSDKILIYDGQILLKDVVSFSLMSQDNKSTIKICLKYNICQEFVITTL